MKKLLFTGLFAALIVACFAQKPYKVVFYNFENLFDTIRNPEIYDEEFTPEGPKKWNTPKYTKKINNLSRVLFDIAAINKDYPVVIGVSEIENRNVMEDVIATPKLAPANYRIVHYDSPDARGVDVAFYYRPDVFKLEGSAPIPFTMESLPNFRTRDVVTMWGTIDGEPFYFMVAHWPSRLGGKEASAPKRERAAEIMRHAADSVLAINPATKVVMMGDFNDDATDKSITEVLGAEGNIRSFVVINLNRAGYETIEAGTGEEALEQLRLNPDVRVALLDIMLPDMDGFEVCRRIRAGNSKIGIIMLTARTQEMDKVTGFMTGADDYVTKPFSPAELTARIDALYRRIGGDMMDDGEIQQPPFVLNTRKRPGEILLSPKWQQTN